MPHILWLGVTCSFYDTFCFFLNPRNIHNNMSNPFYNAWGGFCGSRSIIALNKCQFLGKICLVAFHPSEVFFPPQTSLCVAWAELFARSAIDGLLPILYPLLWSDIREFVRDQTCCRLWRGTTCCLWGRWVGATAVFSCRDFYPHSKKM